MTDYQKKQLPIVAITVLFSVLGIIFAIYNIK